MTGAPDPLRPAHLHIGDMTVDLPLPEAGDPGVILFPGDAFEVWIDDASAAWLAVTLHAILRAQSIEAIDRQDHATRGDAA